MNEPNRGAHAPVPIREGIARRGANCDAVMRAAESFTGAPDITGSRLISLLLNAGPIEYVDREGRQRRLTSTQRLVLLHVVTWVSNAKWESGDAFAWPGNETIAARIDVSVRAVQDALLAAEMAGLLVRRYDQRNHRGEKIGVDLRPLGARAARLQADVEALAQAQADRRDHQRQERADTRPPPANDSSLPADSCTQEYNGKILHVSCTDGGAHVRKSANPVNKAERGSSPRRSTENGRDAAGMEAPRRGAMARQEPSGGEAGNPSENWAFLDDLARPEWLELFAKASPSFRKRLTARTHPFPITSVQSIELVTILRELRDLRLEHFGPANWSYGLRRHGILAIAAMLVAIDKDGVRDPVGYLAGILKKRPNDPTFDPLWDLRQMARRRDN